VFWYLYPCLQPGHPAVLWLFIKLGAMAVFKKKRGGSLRAKWWDYGWNGAYFVTICTHNRIHYFGEVENGKMVLSALGEAAEKCWYEIPRHFPFVKLGSFVVMPDHVHGIIIIDKVRGEEVGVGLELRKGKESRNFAIPLGHDLKNSAGIPQGPECRIHEENSQEQGNLPPGGDMKDLENQYSQGVSRLKGPSQPHRIPQIELRPPLLLPPPSIESPIDITKSRYGPQSRNLSSIVRGYKIGVTKASKSFCDGFRWQTLFHDKIIFNEEAYHRISSYIENNQEQYWKKYHKVL